MGRPFDLVQLPHYLFSPSQRLGRVPQPPKALPLVFPDTRMGLTTLIDYLALLVKSW